MVQLPPGSQQEPRGKAQGLGVQVANIVHSPSHWAVDVVTVHRPANEQHAPGGCAQGTGTHALRSPW